MRNKVISPFERAEYGNVHILRPVYNKLYYPMRYFSANGSSFTRDIPDVSRGTLKKRPISKDNGKYYRSANIDKFEGNSISIGFVGHPETIKDYDEIESGAFVKSTFGRALNTKHDRFINKLIDVEVIDLMADPRIEELDFSEAEREQIMADYRALLNSPKDCVKPFVESYQDKVLHHCQQVGYAQNIGGGCYHILGYSLHTAVFEKAVKACSK